MISCEYDVPRPSPSAIRTTTDDAAPTGTAALPSSEDYDVPPRLQRHSDRSSGVSLLSSASSESSATSHPISNSSESLSLSSALGELYDVPRNVKDVEDVGDVYDVPRPSANVCDADPALYDVPSRRGETQETYDVPAPSSARKAQSLPLSVDSALDTLRRLHVEVTSAVAHLINVRIQGFFFFFSKLINRAIFF